MSCRAGRDETSEQASGALLVAKSLCVCVCVCEDVCCQRIGSEGQFIRLFELEIPRVVCKLAFALLVSLKWPDKVPVHTKRFAPSPVARGCCQVRRRWSTTKMDDEWPVSCRLWTRSSPGRCAASDDWLECVGMFRVCLRCYLAAGLFDQIKLSSNMAHLFQCAQLIGRFCDDGRWLSAEVYSGLTRATATSRTASELVGGCQKWRASSP